MSLMLLKRGVEVVVVAALAALMLVAWPAVAEAQEGAKRGAHTTHASHAVVVVEPGESLWSISEERLGPDATARRVGKHTERLWALNRGRIGPDPNIIQVGQELSLPPIGGRLLRHPPDFPRPNSALVLVTERPG